jgi:hypothetical protein
MQNIGLAADLAILDIGLYSPGGLVDRGLIPLTTACALESGKHTLALSLSRSDFISQLPHAENGPAVKTRADYAGTGIVALRGCQVPWRGFYEKG